MDFWKIDEESLKNQNKLKIWVKNEKTLVSKYCTGSWINLDGYKLWLNQDDIKKVNWENEINELLNEWWDWNDMSDSIRKFLSNKYWIWKSSNELSYVNSDDLFNEKFQNLQKILLKIVNNNDLSEKELHNLSNLQLDDIWIDTIDKDIIENINANYKSLIYSLRKKMFEDSWFLIKWKVDLNEHIQSYHNTLNWFVVVTLPKWKKINWCDPQKSQQPDWTIQHHYNHNNQEIQLTWRFEESNLNLLNSFSDWENNSDNDIICRIDTLKPITWWNLWFYSKLEYSFITFSNWYKSFCVEIKSINLWNKLYEWENWFKELKKELSDVIFLMKPFKDTTIKQDKKMNKMEWLFWKIKTLLKRN